MNDDATKLEESSHDSPGAEAFPELPIEAEPERFWHCGCEFERVEIDLARPEEPLAILEELGPSPFERGGFPVIGFLATTYETVTRYAVERE